MATRLSGANKSDVYTATSATVAVVTLERTDELSHRRLNRLLAAALPRLARFRSRLLAKPLGVGQPVWADIAGYDPTPQIHCAVVRAPGGRRELADLVANLAWSHADRGQTLWEAWSISGLAGGRWAVAIKMSPAINSQPFEVASLWRSLLDAERQTGLADSRPAEANMGPAPSFAELVYDAVIESMERYVSDCFLVADRLSAALRDTCIYLDSSVLRPKQRQASPSSSRPVLRTAFNAPLTGRREVAFVSVPLARVKRISGAFGGTDTNVVLAACTLSVRAWLQNYEAVHGEPLLMRMPVETSATEAATNGRCWRVEQLRVPIHLDDPVEVLTNLHTAAEMVNAIGGDDQRRRRRESDSHVIASLLPRTILHAGMKAYARSGLQTQLGRVGHGEVFCTTVEPTPASVAGAKVIETYTVAPLVEGGLSMVVNFRGDQLDIGVCVCPDTVPAVEDIATGIAHYLDVLTAAAERSPRGQGRSVVSNMASHVARHSGSVDLC